MEHIYFIINNFTGSRYGCWSSIESAECYRNMLDDWMNWDIGMEENYF